MATDTAPLLSPAFLAQLERLELVSRKIFRGRLKGERRSTRKGQSVEFADFRSYVPGDDLRFIDWNTYARLDRLFLKMFFEEEDLHFYALIDDTASMGFGTPTKLRYAEQLAAALGFIGLIRSDRVRIDTISQSAGVPGSVYRGRASSWRLFDQLSNLTLAAQPLSLNQGLKNFCVRNPGKGVVLVISDLLDKAGYQEGLKYLLSRQMDVYVIQVLSAEEIDPSVVGDLKLVDIEDQDVAEISVSPALLKRYKQTLAAFTSEAKDFCTRRGMSYLLASNQLPVEQLVSSYLRTRGLVR
jgi:uncharacterized protein (DUF58 family)